MVNSFIFPFDHGNGSLNNRSKNVHNSGVRPVLYVEIDCVPQL